MDIIVMVGPPGSGKGTYSGKLAERYGYLHISVGDLLRARAQVADEFGRQVKTLMDRNVLLPDDMVNRVLEEHFQTLPENGTVILDGYPRTPSQKDSLDRLVAANGYKIRAAISLQVDDEVVIARILARARNEIDRDRDKILKRLSDYRAQTLPAIEAYRQDGLLKNVKSEGSIEDCVAGVERALGLRPALPGPRRGLDFGPG